MKRLTLLSSIIAATAMLTACGGGSGTPSALGGVVATTPTAPTVPTNPTNPTNPNNPANPTNPTPPSSGVASMGFYKSNAREIVQNNIRELTSSNATLDEFSVTVNGKTYTDGQGLNFAEFGQTNGEFASYPLQEQVKASEGGSAYEVNTSGFLYLFQQQYSAIAMLESTSAEVSINGMSETVSKFDGGEWRDGQVTATLPTAGNHTYNGAYRQKGAGQLGSVMGTLTYNVDFATKEGSGQIDRTLGSNITLQAAPITSYSTTDFGGEIRNVHGVPNGGATAAAETGAYSLAFFGPNAEEILGEVDFASFDGYFGGKR